MEPGMSTGEKSKQRLKTGIASVYLSGTATLIILLSLVLAPRGYERAKLVGIIKFLRCLCKWTRFPC